MCCYSPSHIEYQNHCLLNLETQNKTLKRKLLEIQKKLKSTTEILQEVRTHCTLSQVEIQDLCEDLVMKKGLKKRKNLNTLARVITPLDGKEAWQKKAAEEHQKKEAEAFKIKQKVKLIHTQEIQCIKSAKMKIFTLLLSCYTCKDDLKDIAICFDFTEEDMKSTNVQLKSKIKVHMDSNPVLHENPQFSALFGRLCCGKASLDVEEAQGMTELPEEEPEIPEGPASGFESGGETDSEEMSSEQC